MALVRGSLLAWCELALSPVNQVPAAHHRVMIEHLERLARGEITRLMVLAPPGSAKSTYVSILFPVWYLMNHPASAIIGGSHTMELAEKFSRRVRNLIAEHSGTLGYDLAPDSAAAGRWETPAGGEYFAAGVRGSVTGRRADLMIIDDPVSSRQEADSLLVSERTWDWWRSDAFTRLKPGARVVLVQTRWTEHDLGGRLEEDMAAGGEPWTVLRLPMLAEANDPMGREPGEMLWADWFTPAMLAQAQRDTRTFSALYQQRPMPETGDFFRREWLHPVEHVPARESLRIFGASDYAVTQAGGDYTVHVVLGIDLDDRLYLLDMWRGQASSDVWVESFCDLVIQWKPLGWAEETGQIRAGIGPWLDKRSRERRAFVARETFPTRGDKGVRAQSIRGRMALTGLYYRADAPFRSALETELLGFPAGKNDDVTDSLGLAGQLLDLMYPPSPPPKPKAPEDTWAKAFAGVYGDGDGEDWKTV